MLKMSEARGRQTAAMTIADMQHDSASSSLMSVRKGWLQTRAVSPGRCREGRSG